MTLFEVPKFLQDIADAINKLISNYDQNPLFMVLCVIAVLIIVTLVVDFLGGK